MGVWAAWIALRFARWSGRLCLARARARGEGLAVSLGVASRQVDLLDVVDELCEGPLATTTYGWLAREREQLFPDSMFADMYHAERGRRSVPPSILATMTVLQHLEGLSDREAVGRVAYDMRWKHACGVTCDFGPFEHTVLVGFRARLRNSGDPDRVFRATRDVAASAGLIGAKRALDSTSLFDAVATQDTVTMIRGAIRGVLRVAAGLEQQLRSKLRRDDEYRTPGKPTCDWDDPEERELMIHELTCDAFALLVALDGLELSYDLRRAADLLAVVVGQDIQFGDDGVFRIMRGTATDRVISIVDPDARHGHKSSRSGFDGYKGHIGIDPDSEIITAAATGPANAGDGAAVPELLAELLDTDTNPDTDTGADIETVDDDADDDSDHDSVHGGDVEATVYGDCAYSSGENLDYYDRHGINARTKIQQPHARSGLYAKDRFTIDLDADTVTCPSAVTVQLTGTATGTRFARFASACASCPLMSTCTTSPHGRTIAIGVHERHLTTQRERQRDPDWIADYRANRPKIERKIAHLVRRQHGGRKARVRGHQRVDQDWKLNATTFNISRLAALGVRSISGIWTTQPA